MPLFRLNRNDLNILIIALQKAQSVNDENEESSYIQTSNKEVKVLKMKNFKKKVTFEDLEVDGISISEAEMKKLEQQVCVLEIPNPFVEIYLAVAPQVYFVLCIEIPLNSEFRLSASLKKTRS